MSTNAFSLELYEKNVKIENVTENFWILNEKLESLKA